jgi:hypothetical protein
MLGEREAVNRKTKTWITPEYIAMRDSLFEDRYTRERHYHNAYYDDAGKLQRMCAKCHKDLTDELHYSYYDCP